MATVSTYRCVILHIPSFPSYEPRKLSFSVSIWEAGCRSVRSIQNRGRSAEIHFLLQNWVLKILPLSTDTSTSLTAFQRNPRSLTAYWNKIGMSVEIVDIFSSIVGYLKKEFIWKKKMLDVKILESNWSKLETFCLPFWCI